MKNKNKTSPQNLSTLEKIDEILVRFLAKSNYKKYTNSLNLKGNEKILELGCGTGNLSRFIAKKLSKDGSLTCIDTSNYQLSKARKKLNKYKNIKFQKNITNPKETYDIIILHYILHDIKKNHRQKTIKILKTKLKNNGIIYIREPTRKNHGMPAKEIENLISSSKLKKISSKEIYSLPLRSHYTGTFKKSPTKKLINTKSLPLS